MIATLKRYAIYVAVIVVFGGICFLGGYIVSRYTTKPIIIETHGEIIGKTNIGKPPEVSMVGDCGHRPYIDWCNAMYSDYKQFLLAVPEVYNVTKDKIYFSLHTQKYALTYHASDAAKWWFAPAVQAHVDFTRGAFWGGGILGGYGDIGGGILVDNTLSISALIFYKFEIK